MRALCAAGTGSGLASETTLASSIQMPAPKKKNMNDEISFQMNTVPSVRVALIIDVIHARRTLWSVLSGGKSRRATFTIAMKNARKSDAKVGNPYETASPSQ